MTTGERISQLRKEHSMTQPMLADKLSVSQSTVTSWENDRRSVSNEDLLKLSSLFNVSTDYLLGNTNKRDYYDLTEKDENSIQNQLEEMIDDLSQGGPLAFSKDDSEIDKETRELLIASLENSLRIAKIEAKKKFTPKKYRDK